MRRHSSVAPRRTAAVFAAATLLAVLVFPVAAADAQRDLAAESNLAFEAATSAHVEIDLIDMNAAVRAMSIRPSFGRQMLLAPQFFSAPSAVRMSKATGTDISRR